MMEIVLAFSQSEGIVFLDSRTTAATVSFDVARRLGEQVLSRDIFIDNDPAREQISRAIAAGLAIARRNGAAVLIGHAWSSDLAQLLIDLRDGFAEGGYSLATASQLAQSRAERTIRGMEPEEAAAL